MMNKEERNYRWAYRLLLALAVRCLHDAQNSNNEWPGEQEWFDLVGSSQAIFLKKAREEAGIMNHKEFLEPIRSGKYDVDDLWGQLEKREKQDENWLSVAPYKKKEK